MRIVVIGSGYVGLVSGACFADRGNHVVCLDINHAKIELLQRGEIPIHEPGLNDMVKRSVESGRLIFTSSYETALKEAQIAFIAVGTPPDEDGSADLSHVLEAARSIGQYMDSYLVVVNKSTVPVGTADKVKEQLAEVLKSRGLAAEGSLFDVASNPEFLKEGAAIDDFMKPDRIVLGCDSKKAENLLRKLYAPFTRNHDRIIAMDVRSAELTKYAANAMLATRISFMNELANLSEVVGADIESVRRGIGSDLRIGPHFLYAGVGYGGSCFPKDVKALINTAKENSIELKVVQSVEAANNYQKSVLFQKIKTHFNGHLKGLTIALWGLSFKANTDDMREASSLNLVEALQKAGAFINAYDPVAGKIAKKIWASSSQVKIFDKALDAAQNADALVVVTEWKEFQSPDFGMLASLVKGKTIFDGRNLYDPQDVLNAGLSYYGIGRLNQLVI
jgi:UDPglucose 6-dehydrogenase